jgi:cytochrome c-type biogenesis protein CcmH/NrfF
VSHSYARFAVVCFLIPAAAGIFAQPANGETADEQKARIARLGDAVLAPCCYTEAVSRHQSEIALKMRLEIASWVAAGRTDQEILGDYVQQYGAKVLVDPRTLPRGWAPFLPWLVLILGVFLVLWLLKRWRGRPVPDGIPSTAPAFAVLPDFDEDQ